ncbi:hypothetical protein C8R47DRAFT_1149557 [Mycena vitilis]|nr:hypothetical protein C8R47DRAFT_1149557 [Mycena vitilis]
MHRLVRLIGRRPTVFAPRRLFAAPHLRRYVSQKPDVESLYDQYVAAVSAYQPPQPPVSFEVFSEKLADIERNGVPEEDPVPMQEKYDDMLSALAEMETADPDNFPQRLDELSTAVSDRLEGTVRHVGDTLFQERLENLAIQVKSGSEQEVAQRVAQLVLSTEDRRELEVIEQTLAPYNGPLSVLNNGVEWYLQHPEEIDLPQIKKDEDVPDEVIERELDTLEAEPTAPTLNEKTIYYHQDTPVDELARHLSDRDVQYAIKHRMENQDQENLFELIDRLIVPVFNEDVTVLNAISAIFAKYEDVHLEFQTQPRLPHLRRLEVFKRVLPKLDDETPASEAQSKTELEALVAQVKEKAEIVEAEKRAKRQQWPNLMTRDPLLDSRDVLELPATKENPFHNRVVIRNHHSIFTEALMADSFNFDDPDYEPTRTDDIEQQNKDPYANLPIPQQTIKELVNVPLKVYTAKKQTGKGKLARGVYVSIVGDGKGMVGVGFGKHELMNIAQQKSFRDAVRNMDWVERFEDRTIWTEVRTKFGATTVILRPRPVGFGLRCNPYIHPLLKAAGIKDISAKVWGSRNRIMVVKATLRLLQAGHAPLGMGDGLGGPGRKSHKGTGLRNKSQIERERGRRLVDLRV